MLDQETKKRIDTARLILVGKLPDPKSQVEQITIALIYKFMDDMDKQSEEWGGKASFFTGEYEKYAWTNIFDPKMGGFDLIALYGDALVRLNQNPNIPQLFRDIFKNAYLPFRDPETLRMFLKVINEFKYDHSERLGDAYEYLLSVMSSQGDAGQFRTPRHFIDFMVAVVDPKKTEIVLDPAEGTAGFLISSYKHILRTNSISQNGDRLTSQEKKRLLTNFIGYDISPDMVRLGLVNMYLHGFPDPKIHEYDTLSSEERWGETADVILTNPPFMSPKGGIRPHKRFSIQAKRSEVLFVDYITEHLNPQGRAGVIVPEGIIFQSGTAYKSLRKMLVENFLWCVVSLPAGVFNPYSGVKTSILFMDKAFARKTDNILFVKIENDGYGLGAQRKPIDKNDLPKALDYIQKYQQAVMNDNVMAITDFAHAVAKSRIAESGDWNLSGERYRVNEIRSLNYDLVELGDVVEILDSLRRPITKSDRKPGKYPYYGATGILDYVDGYIFNERLVLVGEDGAKWGEGENSAFIAEGKYWVNNHAHVLRPNPDILIDTFLVNILIFMDLNQYIMGVTVPKLNQGQLRKIKIPLPLLDIQKAIVEEIDGYQKIIDGARQVVENYKPVIKIAPSWEVVELQKMCAFMTGGTPTSTKKEYYEDGCVPWLVSGDIHKGEIFDCEGRITPAGVENSNAKYLPKGSVLIALNGQGKTRGTVAILRMENATCNQSLVSINPNDKSKLLSEYLYYILRSMYRNIRNITGDNQRSGLNISIIKAISIPVAPISVQQEIVAQIEIEQEIVNANKRLIELFEQKIKDKIAAVWLK